MSAVHEIPPDAGGGTPTDPLKPPPKRVEDASETELFDALKAIFAGEEPNLIFEDPPRKGGMFRAECAMMLQDLNPPVYQELNRTGALDEYLDLASHGNRDLYLSLTAQGKAGPQQQATAREVVLAQMREEIVSAQPAHG